MKISPYVNTRTVPAALTLAYAGIAAVKCFQNNHPKLGTAFALSAVTSLANLKVQSNFLTLATIATVAFTALRLKQWRSNSLRLSSVTVKTIPLSEYQQPRNTENLLLINLLELGDQFYNDEDCENSIYNKLVEESRYQASTDLEIKVKANISEAILNRVGSTYLQKNPRVKKITFIRLTEEQK